MSLQRTNLLIQMAQIPATFEGTPSELGAKMVERMQIVSPTGTNFIFTGDTEPTSNVGPWLRGGTKWYVWSEDIKRYVPLDITDSETQWFWAGASTPASTPPLIWIRTTQDFTEASPSFGSPIGWYVFDGTNWVSFTGIVPSGPTTSRPAAPVAFQTFYDTTINVHIWYERNQWRTIDGVPGDVKHVAFDTLEEALTHNPGWEVMGASATSWRGRYISQATKNPGPTPSTDLNVSAGIAERAAHELFGETDGVQMNSSSAVPYPPTIALWTLVKL